MSSNQNHGARILGVTILLGIVISVLAFGRRKEPRVPEAPPEQAETLVLRHRYDLSNPAQTTAEPPSPRGARYSELAPITSNTPAPTSTGSPSASSSGWGQLVALPPPSKPTQPPTAAPPSFPQRRPQTFKTHRIVEGDSLPELAAQYLGSPDRYLELFEANRALLTQPDVLPLGERLVIPHVPAP
ncbi:MAG: hypothetical protein AAGF97_00025 [Planctomycetota bacterium]